MAPSCASAWPATRCSTTCGQRGIERELIPLCAEQGVAVVGYTPFGGFPRGLQRRRRCAGGDRRRHGVTPRQVVLRFLTRTAERLHDSKAVDPEHVRENAGAGDFELDAADVETIERLFPKPSSP